MSNESAATSGPILFDRYRIKQQLGTGRLATVYHALDERLQRDVLVHVLRKDLVGQEKLRQRFLTEINASAQNSHPSLLGVYDTGEVGGRPFMVTEYVQGRPLKAIGTLKLEHALLYTRQVAGAVSTCLANNLPHPPISSNNVLLTGEGQVKLVESWHIPSSEVALDLAHYRAPERTEGKPPAPSNVIYALGLLLYELITGTRPINGTDPHQVAQAHLQERIPPLSQVRPTTYLPTLERLIERATTRFPEQRFANVITFSEEIDALSRSLNSETQRLSVTPTAPRPKRAEARTAVQQPAPTPPQSANPSAQPIITTNDLLHPMGRSSLQRKSFMHSLMGWVVMLTLMIVIVLASYTVATFVVDQVFAIKLPRPTLPDMGIELPDWVPWKEQHEVLVVNIDSNEGLNLRDAPGIATNVITTIPSGTLVYKLEGPVIADDIEWVRVRTEAADGKPIEGWMSLLYLKAEP